ncbi:hypothetical protein CEV34_2906 [Brucella pseudogrignonensis]|jgi:hypothetical protein|uniref:Uncharacterized protein n=1 Tax=Brucella pseudogrignonensis TaxID=419475 RepID=A0A256GES2_9HYPH|nr:hypothetical protein CEV34_2906 [Brucella pseudogrignonensis]
MNTFPLAFDGSIGLNLTLESPLNEMLFQTSNAKNPVDA